MDKLRRDGAQDGIADPCEKPSDHCGRGLITWLNLEKHITNLCNERADMRVDANDALRR